MNPLKKFSLKVFTIMEIRSHLIFGRSICIAVAKAHFCHDEQSKHLAFSTCWDDEIPRLGPHNDVATVPCAVQQGGRHIAMTTNNDSAEKLFVHAREPHILS